MRVLNLLLVLAAAGPDDGLAKKMLPIYVKEISEYSLAVKSAPKKKLDLKKEPIFEWSNPVRSGMQQGVVFLWLREGKDQEVFSSVPGVNNPSSHDPLHLYRIYPEKVVTPDGKLLARTHQTSTGVEVIPVKDK